jgi:hypothetical protein
MEAERHYGMIPNTIGSVLTLASRFCGKVFDFAKRN